MRLYYILVSLSLIMSITSCSNRGDSWSPIREIEEKTSIDLGTKGLLIPIQSENVRAAGYDAETLVMTVQFRNGYLYEYYGVSADVWTSFVAAQPNPWSQVGYPSLVQSGIPYKRIG